MSEEIINSGITVSDLEKVNGAYEAVPYERSQVEAEALAQAVSAFEKDRRNASFSKRNPDLGKMINCSLCGMRHRVHDPVMLNSTAHSEQVFGDVKFPSRAAFFAKKRLHPHFKQKNRDFVKRVQDLIQDYGGIEGLDDEQLEKKLKMVKGIVKAQMNREFDLKQKRVRAHQNQSRRINRERACS